MTPVILGRRVIKSNMVQKLLILLIMPIALHATKAKATNSKALWSSNKNVETGATKDGLILLLLVPKKSFTGSRKHNYLAVASGMFIEITLIREPELTSTQAIRAVVLKLATCH